MIEQAGFVREFESNKTWRPDFCLLKNFTNY